jgi:nucleoid DNA-binding protein/DNA-directed RNA polymerase subunit RPC12/RpoP
MKKTSYTKASLIRELAANAEITQKKARFILDELTRIAYREAADGGFTVPGICRLDVVLRKPRRMKNPQTGETILIGEHHTLRARVVNAARNAVTPPPDNLVTVLPKEGPTQAELEDFSNAVSFRCKNCKQEIEAPRAAVGIEARCPACGASITVPAESEAGTLHGPALQSPPAPTVPPAAASATPTPPSTAASPASLAADPGTPPASADPASASPSPSPAPATSEPSPAATFAEQKARGGQTIRIDLAALGFVPEDEAKSKTLSPKRMLSFFCKNCRQEIEAPADMAGLSSECPACGVSFEIPFFSDPGTLHGSDLDDREPGDPEVRDARARTIRIEVPDDF